MRKYVTDKERGQASEAQQLQENLRHEEDRGLRRRAGARPVRNAEPNPTKKTKKKKRKKRAKHQAKEWKSGKLKVLSAGKKIHQSQQCRTMQKLQIWCHEGQICGS